MPKKKDIEQEDNQPEESKALDVELSKNEELLVLKELSKELEEKLLRAQAEIENTRKIAQKEIIKSKIFSAETIVRDLLIPIDNLYRSLEHKEEGISSDWIELVLKDITEGLKNSNIEEIYPLNEKFDPSFHEALSVRKDDNKETDIVLDVMQRGYKIQDRVIRPARVIVNKK